MKRPRTIESVILPRSKAKGKDLRIFLLLALTLACSPQALAQKSAVSGESVYSLTQQFLAVAPKRYNGSPGHLAAEKFISDHFKPEAARGNFEKDEFTVNTPAGPQTMRNYIVRYPGKRDGIIVLTSHYETNYPLRNIHFVGANDGACTSALLIAIGQYLRVHPPTGYSVWLLFDDGEEAVQDWNYSAYTDHTYGTRHLAAKWYSDGTDRRIKAFIVADMIGDKDFNIDRVTNSTPWLLDALRTAAKNTGHSANIFRYSEDEQDDHEPFAQRGVPVIDLIDAHYGPSTVEMPDGYHHTADDTIDKISPQSLQISADIILELIRLINQR
jgi:Zn-dependent M28 family amino/carboxypeptidase